MAASGAVMAAGGIMALTNTFGPMITELSSMDPKALAASFKEMKEAGEKQKLNMKKNRAAITEVVSMQVKIFVEQLVQMIPVIIDAVIDAIPGIVSALVGALPEIIKFITRDDPSFRQMEALDGLQHAEPGQDVQGGAHRRELPHFRCQPGEFRKGP